MSGAEIRVRGMVQGVGFRPTVWRLATECGLTGRVLNDGAGVLIEAEGPEPALHTVEAFFAENGQAVIDAAQSIAETYDSGGRLFTMGNGGSSCDAAHVAVQALYPFLHGKRQEPASRNAALVESVRQKARHHVDGVPASCHGRPPGADRDRPHRRPYHDDCGGQRCGLRAHLCAFARQLIAQGRKGDCLVGMSTSEPAQDWGPQTLAIPATNRSK